MEKIITAITVALTILIAVVFVMIFISGNKSVDYRLNPSKAINSGGMIYDTQIDEAK